MVIFHSYVSLPEGRLLTSPSCWADPPVIPLIRPWIFDHLFGWSQGHKNPRVPALGLIQSSHIHVDIRNHTQKLKKIRRSHPSLKSSHIPWISHGYPMAFPWLSHGFPISTAPLRARPVHRRSVAHLFGAQPQQRGRRGAGRGRRGRCRRRGRRGPQILVGDERFHRRFTGIVIYEWTVSGIFQWVVGCWGFATPWKIRSLLV